MRITLLVASMLVLASCGAAESQTKAGTLPDFHFPQALGKPTAIEMEEPPLDHMPAELAGQVRDLRRARNVLFAEMERNVNSAAKGLVKRVGTSKKLAADLLTCDEFCGAIDLRIRHHRDIEIKRVATELRRFCRACLDAAPLSKLNSAPSSFNMEEQIIRCDVALHDDESAHLLAVKVLKDNAAQNAFFIDGQVEHDLNMILAEIAFRKKDLDGACARLHLAGQTKGSPSLNSFGPRFPLVLDLIKAGRRSAVIDYLEGISKFWQGSLVQTWIKTLRSGGMPSTGFEWQWGTREHVPLDD